MNPEPRQGTEKRPYMYYSDLQLAQALVPLEKMLDPNFEQIDFSDEEREGICFMRNHIIEEIIFRYQNPIT